MSLKKIKNITIEPGCITCGLCEFIAPEVFEVTDISHVKKDADMTAHQSAIRRASAECPVNVIVCKEIVCKEEDNT